MTIRSPAPPRSRINRRSRRWAIEAHPGSQLPWWSFPSAHHPFAGEWLTEAEVSGQGWVPWEETRADEIVATLTQQLIDLRVLHSDNTARHTAVILAQSIGLAPR
jgi:hypothetical protein